jgi:hypothetical protein
MTNSHKHDVQEIYFYIYHVHELKRNVVRDIGLYYKFFKNWSNNLCVIYYINLMDKR